MCYIRQAHTSAQAPLGLSLQEQSVPRRHAGCATLHAQPHLLLRTLQGSLSQSLPCGLRTLEAGTRQGASQCGAGVCACVCLCVCVCVCVCARVCVLVRGWDNGASMDACTWDACVCSPEMPMRYRPQGWGHQEGDSPGGLCKEAYTGAKRCGTKSCNTIRLYQNFTAFRGCHGYYTIRLYQNLVVVPHAPLQGRWHEEGHPFSRLCEEAHTGARDCGADRARPQPHRVPRARAL